MTFDTAPFLATCVSIDLEVDPKSARIFAFAAVRGERAVVHKGAALEPALDRLEALCDGAAHLVGHNVLRHDLPHLVANRARLAGLGSAPIDTLWLNPLAFPRNPYHHLVKHYQDGRLQVGHVNDPEQDARLALQALSDQIAAFTRLGQEAPDALLAYHHLTTRDEASAGFDALFQFLRGAAPGEAAAHDAIRRLLDGRACNHRLDQTLGRLSDPRNGWPMAYALSWISVAGGDSVMPPWVRMRFPQAGRIVRHLRDTNCGDPGCAWCVEKNNPNAALERWFGFPSFRPQPVDDMGRPLQERIVAEAMAGKSVLGILPTGTGKSVCYQIPALSRFDKTGALTVVISPLVALMAYEACEVALVLFLRKFGRALLARAGSPAALQTILAKVTGLLPTHTRRSEEMVRFQQFSTPLPMGLAAMAAAQITPVTWSSSLRPELDFWQSSPRSRAAVLR